ncbi:hypothetical protein [Methanolacinia paynteri]|uniref:hypothetical protein n=1 Tax=Methanolacinia paynteri TaxID=230356 RepID=UPI0012F65E9A|nr:hypothetical protein [Methanolacinia paynteri]
MKKRMIAALIILIAFFLVVLFYIQADSDYISAHNKSKLVSGTESAPSGQNISTESAGQAESPDNYTGSYSSEGPDELFSEIASVAHGYGEYVLYDEDGMQILSEGDERSDISLSVGRTKTMNRMYLKDLYSGHEYEISPPAGFKFLLVSVTAAPVAAHLERHTTPATRDFIVVDPSENITPNLNFAEGLGAVIENDVSHDTMINGRFVIRGVGEIYVGKEVFSSLNAVEGSGALTGWIIYDVAENYSVSPDTYLELELGGEKVYWRLHDIQVDFQVMKNYDTGRITVSYNGGPESYFIRAIEAKLVKADGSVEDKSVESAEDEEYLPKTEFFLSGSPGEQDQLSVKVVSSYGEEYTKYLNKI